MHDALRRLDGDKDGLARYGRGSGQKPAPTRRTDKLFIYCPACRAGQRLAP